MKKLFTVILLIVVLLTSFSVISNAQEIKLGDINADGKITASDARKILRFSAKLDDWSDDIFVYADVNFDDKITAKDARMVLRAAAKIEILSELVTNGTLPDETTTNNDVERPGMENYHGHVYTGGSSSKKYHYEAECAGKYSHEITWEEVEQCGLGPCGTCVLN